MIVYPFYRLENLKEKKRELENDILNQKDILKLQNEKIKDLKNKKEFIKKKREKLEIEEKGKIFDYSSDVYDFLQEKLEKYNLKIELMGRELTQKLDEKKSEGCVYLEVIGKEKNIFKFLDEIEKSSKYIWTVKEGFFLERKDRYLSLKGNYMYIIKNKDVEKGGEIKEKREIFKKNIKRKIGGSVRKI